MGQELLVDGYRIVSKRGIVPDLLEFSLGELDTKQIIIVN